LREEDGRRDATVTGVQTWLFRSRRGRDSNPRYPVKGTTVFETAPIDHSGTSPRSAMGEVGLRKPPLPEGWRSLPQGTRAPQRAEIGRASWRERRSSSLATRPEAR